MLARAWSGFYLYVDIITKTINYLNIRRASGWFNRRFRWAWYRISFQALVLVTNLSLVIFQAKFEFLWWFYILLFSWFRWRTRWDLLLRPKTWASPSTLNKRSLYYNWHWRLRESHKRGWIEIRVRLIILFSKNWIQWRRIVWFSDC